MANFTKNKKEMSRDWVIPTGQVYSEVKSRMVFGILDELSGSYRDKDTFLKIYGLDDQNFSIISRLFLNHRDRQSQKGLTGLIIAVLEAMTEKEEK